MTEVNSRGINFISFPLSHNEVNDKHHQIMAERRKNRRKQDEVYLFCYLSLAVIFIYIVALICDTHIDAMIFTLILLISDCDIVQLSTAALITVLLLSIIADASFFFFKTHMVRCSSAQGMEVD